MVNNCFQMGRAFIYLFFFSLEKKKESFYGYITPRVGSQYQARPYPILREGANPH